MAIWFAPNPDLVALNTASATCMVGHVGIELTAIGDDWIEGRMPVDHRTRQPFGLLHGGASVVLAETLGSVAGSLVVDPFAKRVVGLEINANHVRGARDGWVVGRATPEAIGRSTHVWSIRICDEQERLVCVSRITLAVLDARPA